MLLRQVFISSTSCHSIGMVAAHRARTIPIKGLLVRPYNTKAEQTHVPQVEEPKATPPQATTTKIDNTRVTFPIPDPVHGSYHWTFERSLSIVLVPITAAQFIAGAHPLTDALLGVVLPLHCHIGMGAIITDYIPARKNARVHKLAVWGMRLATVGVLVGCYNINTKDVGMTEVVKRVWSA